jgi:paraquat-inducible protein B
VRRLLTYFTYPPAPSTARRQIQIDQERPSMDEGATAKPGTPNRAEREFETGEDEFFKAHSELTAANEKRTFDAYQHPNLEHVTNNQRLFEQSAANLQTQLAATNNITLQHLQNAVTIANQVAANAVENANIIAKRTAELNNLANDSFWNPVSAGAGMNLTAGAAPANRVVDETGAVAAGATNASIAAIAAAVANQLTANLTPTLAVLQQMIQSLAAATASIANVLSQAQPKPTA